MSIPEFLGVVLGASLAVLGITFVVCLTAVVVTATVRTIRRTRP